LSEKQIFAKIRRLISSSYEFVDNKKKEGYARVVVVTAEYGSNG